MKKFLSLLLALLCVAALPACSGFEKTEKDVLSSMIGKIDLSKGEVTTYASEHEVLNKGTTYGEVLFSDDSFLGTVKSHKDWKSLPMSEDASTLFFGGEMPLFPAVTNGYYYFRDRHKDCTDATDESQFLKRETLNYTVAVYNADTKMLYVYVYNT